MTDTSLAPRELPGDEYAYWREAAMAINCLCNALLAGWHHEGMSSRSWRAWSNGKVFGKVFRPLIDALFVWETGKMDHCQRHYDAEVARAALIVGARA